MKTSHAGQMIGITSPDVGCEVTITWAGDATVWVNVDGVCRLRISKIKLDQLSVNYNPAQLPSKE